VLGGGSEPGYVEGYGVIDAEQVCRLAEELRYQPSAAVHSAVRLRDLTCRFPGCDRRAVVCDVDHTVAFNHADPRSGGLTVAWNLKCLCRQQVQPNALRQFRSDDDVGGFVSFVPTMRAFRVTLVGGPS
jgi:hypothetical protein